MEVVLWFFCALTLLAAGAGAYAFVRERLLGKAPSETVHLDDGTNAFVGSRGLGVPLRIRRLPGKLHVEWGLSNYILLIVITGAFGPGIIAMFFLKRREFDGMPLPVAIMLGLLVAFATITMLQKIHEFFFRRPRVEISLEGVQFRRGKEPPQIFRKRDIAGLDMVETTYHSKQREVPNHTLRLVMEDGSKVALCITDNKEQIDTLERDIRQMLNLNEPGVIPGAARDLI